MPMNSLKALLVSVVVPSVLFAQAPRGGFSQGVSAITGVTAITMTGRDSVIPNATIVIRDGRIAAIGPSSRVTVPPGATRIDGRGKFVIPGLADMHAHLYADEFVPDSVGPYELGVYLANGVTTARLMIGTPLHFTLRRAIQAGTLAGPQLWIASPEVTGTKTAH